MSLEPERLAWMVLEIANRTQAKGSTVRLIFPRDPQVFEALGRTFGTGLADEDLPPVENYLLEHGYVALVDIGLSIGSYSITTSGFEWLEECLAEPPIMSRGIPDQPKMSGGAEYGAPEPSESEPELEESRRPWWRRLSGMPD